ncbi:endopeptidase domain containing protein [Pandoravirus japonicus]|uniref:Endopeptidase domain containing protein n=1 Tax=Pandoravirus japonicus TaxID=2823154 RepID=A0A811BND7_9VIRU|nr:endopeptidase domain containing protein [Pandoravirus japonicus]
MSDGDAAWSGWGAPHPQAPATPFGVGVVFGGHPHGVATSTTATPTVSKNRARRQRRDLAGAARAPLRPARESDAATDSDDGAGDDAAYAHVGPADSLRPLASPLRQPMAAVVVDITRSSEKENQSNDRDHHHDRDHDHDRDHEDNDDDDKHGDAARDDPTERQPGGGRRRKGTVPSARCVAATTDALDDATSTDDGDDSLGDLSEDDGDRRVAAQTKGSDDGRTMVVARASRRDHKSDTHEGGAVTRISARHRQKSSSPSSSIIVEGDVLSCRTCGAPSTARRSARMGVYVGDGWVVHAAQRRHRTTASSRSSARYDVVQQTLRDFADGRTLSADEWFRTRSEFPAAVRVRRALERVGAEWEVPEGLDDARASEDFALWAATGQSALTHADYRDDRDPPPGPSSSSSTSRRRDKERRDGVVARAVRLGSDSPPPVLARIHQPAAALSASPPTRPPAPPATDYRHVVAGGLVGLYLGGPVGGAVGGAAGLLLDSMASLGRAWRP